MKSNLEDCVVGLYGSLLEDFVHVHPTMRQEIERFDRLGSIVTDRGLSFFTITLPDCNKYFRKCLSAGRLLEGRPAYHGQKSKSDPRPTFLWGLWSMVFDDAGVLRVVPSIDAIAALTQLYSFAKKLRIECTEERVNDAIIEFLEIDASLPPSHSGTWDIDDPTWMPRKGHPLWGARTFIRQDQPSFLAVPSDNQISVMVRRWDAFSALCAYMTAQLGYLDPYAMKPKHGPGAVSDRYKSEIKYSFRSWPRKLAQVFPYDWNASYDFVDRSVDDREVPSKIIAVPKTQRAPRIIAAEPTAHQWIQGGIQRWLTARIRATFLGLAVDLHDQRPSQQLALEGSKSGNLATLDLSSASDRLSTRLVEYVFQKNTSILDALHASRTRAAEVRPRELVMLRKFACMGSACTFPVQTIVFTMLSMFSIMEADDDYRISDDRIRALAKQVRVFGDDIIIPAHANDALTSILSDVGLKVNVAKSFAEGNFRESCGMDAYAGEDVTPAYFLQPYKASNPESLVSAVECSNNFHRKGLWHAADFLLKTVEPQLRKLLRTSNRDVSQPSLFTFVDGVEPGSRTRWNRDLQREEIYQLVLHNKQAIRKGSGEAALLQYFTEAPSSDYPYENGEAQRSRVMVKPGWSI